MLFMECLWNKKHHGLSEDAKNCTLLGYDNMSKSYLFQMVN